MFKAVGACEAKAKLFELLRAVQKGQRYTITVWGKPVADLVPSETVTCYDVKAAIKSMREFEKVSGVTSLEMSEITAEGRR